MKPGQSPNVASPELSAGRGISDAAQVGRGSHQDAETTQTASMNPNRLVPSRMPSDEGGKAEIDPSGVMEGQTSDFTASQRTRDGLRKKMFLSNP